MTQITHDDFNNICDDVTCALNVKRDELTIKHFDEFFRDAITQHEFEQLIDDVIDTMRDDKHRDDLTIRDFDEYYRNTTK